MSVGHAAELRADSMITVNVYPSQLTLNSQGIANAIYNHMTLLYLILTIWMVDIFCLIILHAPLAVTLTHTTHHQNRKTSHTGKYFQTHSLKSDAMLGVCVLS